MKINLQNGMKIAAIVLAICSVESKLLAQDSSADEPGIVPADEIEIIEEELPNIEDLEEVDPIDEVEIVDPVEPIEPVEPEIVDPVGGFNPTACIATRKTANEAAIIENQKLNFDVSTIQAELDLIANDSFLCVIEYSSRPESGCQPIAAADCNGFTTDFFPGMKVYNTSGPGQAWTEVH